MHEVDLRPDDIVVAHQAGVEGQPNAKTGKEVTFICFWKTSECANPIRHWSTHADTEILHFICTSYDVCSTTTAYMSV